MAQPLGLPWLPIYSRVFNLEFQWRKDETTSRVAAVP
jgi:hypothetical protein